MKIKELREKAVPELEKLLREEQERLRSGRFAVSTSQEAKVRRIRETRKTIARILGLLTQNAKR